MSPFRSRVLDEVGRLDQLPSLPTIVTQLLEVMDDPLASALDVAHILREDPPLTARVLRLANSALYGGRTRVMSVPQAVLRVGMLEIRNVVVSLSLISSMKRYGRRLNYRVFWQHSLTIALATEALTRLVPGDETEDDDGAFATGLLHDIGRLVLDQFYPEAYDEATRVAEADNVPLVDAERRILDTDHAEIGAHLAARWQLPDPIVRGIRLHHSSEETAPSLGRLSALIHVAELVCNANGLGDPLERARPAVPDAALAAIGVGDERSEDVLEATVAAARKSSALLVFSN